MKTEEFDYYLPEKLIAQTPLNDRSSSRLMILDRKTGEIEHKHFYNIIDYLNNMHNVLYKVRKISNSKIFIINLYNRSNKFELVNKKLFDYSKKYDLEYIDLNKLEFDKYYVISDKYYLNSKGMNKIGNFLLKNRW